MANKKAVGVATPPIGYYSNPDEAKRLEIIELLKSKYRKIISKKKSFVFHPVANFLMIKPLSFVVVDGFKIGLRYSTQFDTPFMDEQKTNEAVRVEMVNLDGEDPQTVTASEMCKLMFLLLHKQNHDNIEDKSVLSLSSPVTFFLEDLERDAKDEFEFFKLEDEARTLIREGDINDIMAAYYVLSGEAVENMGNMELRSALIRYSKDSPEDIIEAFADKKTKIKFKFRSAMLLGYIYTSPDGTELKSSKTNNVILDIPVAADMELEFAAWCASDDKGKAFFKVLEEDLKK